VSFSQEILEALKAVSSAFWFANAFVPIFLLAGSLFLRAKEAGSLTTGADAVLALATFDAVAICSAEEFRKHMTVVLQANVVSVHAFFFGLAFLVWFPLIKYAEPALKRRSIASIEAWGIALLGLLGFAILVIFHVVAYVGAG
jgi:hypothetical protein